MKPAPFRYTDPTDLASALATLTAEPEAKVLAGGQSLMPLLAMRLARPDVIVDLSRVDSLREIRVGAHGELSLGAMVTHGRLVESEEVRSGWPLLAYAARLIGHEAIRTRGTIGGSLVHADPAAELPCCVTLLDGVLTLERDGGESRSVPASEFFITYLTTDVQPGEILTRIELPAPPPRSGMAFEEIARRSGDFALAGAGAVVSLAPDGRVADARVGLCGVSGTPVVVTGLEPLLGGHRGSGADFEAVAEAVRADLEPDDDLHASAEYRRHVAGVAAVRALRRALEHAGV
jgi:carbon-monoxide dehydrogenase medium subunit